VDVLAMEMETSVPCKRPVFNWICGPEVRIPATEAMDDIDFGE
jgi:hypothetical protein